jgi:hypothetical protein
LARRGHQITVVQAFHEDRTEQRGEVKFVYSQAPYRSAARLSGGSIGVDLLCRRNLERVLSAVAAAWPDAVHMNGITLQQPLAALSQWCGVTRRRLTGGEFADVWSHDRGKVNGEGLDERARVRVADLLCRRALRPYTLALNAATWVARCPNAAKTRHSGHRFSIDVRAGAREIA